MARSTKTADAPATDEVVEPTTDETPEATAEAEAVAETKTDEYVPADLTAFQSAVSSVVGAADSTGDLTDEQVEVVREQYRLLPTTKDRNAAKKDLDEGMKSAMDDRDIVKARSYLQLKQSMTVASSGGGGGTKAPADPTARWRQQLEIATLAYGELLAQRPEGITDEQVSEITNGTASLSEQVASYRAFLDSDDESAEKPEVDSRVTAAFRIVNGGRSKARASSGSTYTGERRDLNKHFAEAFASKASGDFMTIAQIRSFKSEEYGDDHPSAGAISARLFPSKGESTVEGVRPGTGGEKGQRGAFKL